MIRFLKYNIFVHFITNILLLNFVSKKGRNNKVFGFFLSLLSKTKISFKGTGNKISLNKGSKLSNVKIFVIGNNNNIFINELVSIKNSTLWIIGNDNTISLGDNSHIYNTEIGLDGNGGSFKADCNVKICGYIEFGRTKTITLPVGIYAFEGKSITVGKETCISSGVEIRTGDSHPIYDESNNRINDAADVKIGKGVWIAPNCVILKGAGIGDCSVLGHSSLLIKDFSHNNNVIIAGSPAKIVRENISWKLDL